MFVKQRPFGRMNLLASSRCACLQDIHPFVELGDSLTLFEWAFREDTMIRAEACFLVSAAFIYALDNANEIRSCFAHGLLAFLIARWMIIMLLCICFKSVMVVNMNAWQARTHQTSEASADPVVMVESPDKHNGLVNPANPRKTSFRRTCSNYTTPWPSFFFPSSEDINLLIAIPH
jgi:hypothetical protein